jgi:hypothetical protein
MSGSDNMDSRPVDNRGEEVPPVNIHPKLMTNRNSTSNPTSARQHTPHSARSEGCVAATVPRNTELAEAGVPPQDGVVRQLSARKHESGALAAPRDVSGNTSGRRAPPAIAAGGGIGEPLQLSEARQRRVPQQQHQPARHAPYAGGSRASAGASREPVRPSRHDGHSPFRSPSKHSDPYGHVTSIVHEYLNNNISALEAQYKNVRSHSAAHVSQFRDPAEHRSASRHPPQPSQPQHINHEAYTPRSARQGSPQPRQNPADYLRGGVPRAALDAPHIKYAEALEHMNSARYSPRAARAYTPSTSTAPTAFLPQVAQLVPERFKYVEPSAEEKKRHKEETLRLLQEWRERQKMRSTASASARVRAASSEPQQEQRQPSSAKASARKRSSSNKRIGKPPVEWPSAASRKSTPATVRGEEKPEWDTTFQPGFGTPPRSPRTASRTPRSARSGRKSGAASCASSRKGRKSRGATPPATAREEAGVNPNAFRRRLLFDVTAPTLSVM